MGNNTNEQNKNMKSEISKQIIKGEPLNFVSKQDH
jgi:hypothetical protein